MLVHAAFLGINAIIVISKVDKSGIENDIISQYENAGVKIIKTSSYTLEGKDELEAAIKGKFSALAGQSGVGKTSIINMLNPDAFMETGELSQKNKRGKNTTRAAEIVTVERLDCMIADTPGFSSLDSVEIEPQDLSDYYYEFNHLEFGCKFDRCVHINEPFCAVKDALNDKKISVERYDRYVSIYNEIKKRKDLKYV